MKTSVQIIIGATVFVVLAGAIGVCVFHNKTHRGMKEIY